MSAAIDQALTIFDAEIFVSNSATNGYAAGSTTPTDPTSKSDPYSEMWRALDYAKTTLTGNVKITINPGDYPMRGPSVAQHFSLDEDDRIFALNADGGAVNVTHDNTVNDSNLIYFNFYVSSVGSNIALILMGKAFYFQHENTNPANPFIRFPDDTAGARLVSIAEKVTFTGANLFWSGIGDNFTCYFRHLRIHNCSEPIVNASTLDGDNMYFGRLELIDNESRRDLGVWSQVYDTRFNCGDTAFNVDELIVHNTEFFAADSRANNKVGIGLAHMTAHVNHDTIQKVRGDMVVYNGVIHSAPDDLYNLHNGIVINGGASYLDGDIAPKRTLAARRSTGSLSLNFDDANSLDDFVTACDYIATQGYGHKIGIAVETHPGGTLLSAGQITKIQAQVARGHHVYLHGRGSLGVDAQIAITLVGAAGDTYEVAGGVLTVRHTGGTVAAPFTLSSYTSMNDLVNAIAPLPGITAANSSEYTASPSADPVIIDSVASTSIATLQNVPISEAALLQSEITDAKTQLESLTGATVNAFVYPNGVVTVAAAAAIEAAGMAAGRAVRNASGGELIPYNISDKDYLTEYQGALPYFTRSFSGNTIFGANANQINIDVKRKAAGLAALAEQSGYPFNIYGHEFASSGDTMTEDTVERVFDGLNDYGMNLVPFDDQWVTAKAHAGAVITTDSSGTWNGYKRLTISFNDEISHDYRFLAASGSGGGGGGLGLTSKSALSRNLLNR
ncbi:hypothetical protein [uncultured Paraglaciecola sp.]|uniref:hypothetical protein n=1 Tax=uncultured Paraglaciecola sp. TaxID=1765024 RepID=UPI002607A1DC|nr:hypothetical protein [uncultured Paraglaciecola sp.]